MKLKSVIINQDQREDIGFSSGDENPRAVYYREDQPDMMQVGNPETSDNEQIFLEARPNSDTGMYHTENDPCCTDPDTEDVTMVPAGQIYEKLMASEMCQQIQITDIHMQSHPCAALKKQCLPVEMSANPNIEKKKTELLRGCGQIDDVVSGEHLQQNEIDVINSAEIPTISEEQSAGQQSCPQPLDFSLSQQGTSCCCK